MSKPIMLVVAFLAGFVAVWLLEHPPLAISVAVFLVALYVVYQRRQHKC